MLPLLLILDILTPSQPFAYRHWVWTGCVYFLFSFMMFPDPLESRYALERTVWYRKLPWCTQEHTPCSSYAQSCCSLKEKARFKAWHPTGSQPAENVTLRLHLFPSFRSTYWSSHEDALMLQPLARRKFLSNVLGARRWLSSLLMLLPAILPPSPLPTSAHYIKEVHPNLGKVSFWNKTLNQDLKAGFGALLVHMRKPATTYKSTVVTPFLGGPFHKPYMG